MAKRKVGGSVATRSTRRVGPRSGLTRVTFSIELEQLSALQSEAVSRAQARGSLKPDASEVVREALDAWLKRRS